MEDKVLVERAQKGDRNAFAELVERYQTPVYNLAYRMLGQAEDAEDAAQESFLRAYAHLKQVRPDERFATWLLSVAAHLCIDRLRRRRFVWLSMDIEGTEDLWKSDAPGPDDEVLRHENQREIERLLDKLSPESRLAVVLHYWHEQSVEEIARTTGSSVSAVKVRLHRARKMLARAISNADSLPFSAKPNSLCQGERND